MAFSIYFDYIFFEVNSLFAIKRKINKKFIIIFSISISSFEKDFKRTSRKDFECKFFVKSNCIDKQKKKKYIEANLKKN